MQAHLRPRARDLRVQRNDITPNQADHINATRAACLENHSFERVYAHRPLALSCSLHHSRPFSLILARLKQREPFI